MRTRIDKLAVTLVLALLAAHAVAQENDREDILALMEQAFDAIASGEYEFWINGGFSHCGVDAANVVKIDGEWKIANWMWTVERDNCETASSPVSK